MVAENIRSQLQSDFRRLKPLIDSTYPAGRFVAVHDGRLVADDSDFDALMAQLVELGVDPVQALVAQAGVEYPEHGTILLKVSVRIPSPRAALQIRTLKWFALKRAIGRRILC